MGPYGPSLAEDYHSLSVALATGENEYKDYTLRDSVVDQLERLKPLLKPPRGMNLTKDDWLELVASVHFLSKVVGYRWDEVKEVLHNEKPHLGKYASKAKDALRSIGLL
ncbi:unnamed protein product [marine sediment metagenome]|uniref:Uncharacterized protein n=1 Tax=marine sediment metagenome TaxID=412755 RepID=X1NVX7_9ZZZZ